MANVAKNTSVALRRKLAVELRAAGKSNDEIAVLLSKKFGTPITPERVSQDIRRYLKDVPKEDLETVLQLELHRLDKAQELASLMIKARDPKGIDAQVKVMDRRSKYLGLDKTEKDNDYSEVDQWLAGHTEVDFEFDPAEIGINGDEEIEDPEELEDDEGESDLE